MPLTRPDYEILGLCLQKNAGLAKTLLQFGDDAVQALVKARAAASEASRIAVKQHAATANQIGTAVRDGANDLLTTYKRSQGDALLSRRAAANYLIDEAGSASNASTMLAHRIHTEPITLAADTLKGAATSVPNTAKSLYEHLWSPAAPPTTSLGIHKADPQSMSMFPLLKDWAGEHGNASWQDILLKHPVRTMTRVVMPEYGKTGTRARTAAVMLGAPALVQEVTGVRALWDQMSPEQKETVKLTLAENPAATASLFVDALAGVPDYKTPTGLTLTQPGGSVTIEDPLRHLKGEPVREAIYTAHPNGRPLTLKLGNAAENAAAETARGLRGAAYWPLVAANSAYKAMADPSVQLSPAVRQVFGLPAAYDAIIDPTNKVRAIEDNGRIRIKAEGSKDLLQVVRERANDAERAAIVASGLGTAKAGLR